MKIGFTCSAFDLFHAGHITMLRDAKEHCDFLIVGLQTDPTIDRPTKNRPVQTVYERWVQLAACQYVDRIIPYATEKELLDILQSQDITIRFVGEEYQSQPFTGKDIDGIEIHYNKRRHSFSSTELRQRVFTAQISIQVEKHPGAAIQGAVGSSIDRITGPYYNPENVAKASPK
jgi:glycerol-3-phosphate cytidylyltransferase